MRRRLLYIVVAGALVLASAQRLAQPLIGGWFGSVEVFELKQQIRATEAESSTLEQNIEFLETDEGMDLLSATAGECSGTGRARSLARLRPPTRQVNPRRSPEIRGVSLRQRGRRSSPRGVSRPRAHVPSASLALAALLAIAGAGCQPQHRDRDRWPIAVARDLEGRPEVAYLSPIYPHDAVALTSPGAPLARFDAWVSCVAAAPGAPGFLVFAGDEAFHLTHVGDRLQSTAVGRTGCWVRAASVTTAPDGSESGPPSRRLRRTGLEPDLLMALICGGEVQPSPRQTDAEDEPVPWLMNAEVRLARVEEGRLVLGEAEVPAELNPWRIKSGRFAGEENLLVFVYKRSPFDPIARRRPFVYRVIGGEDGRIHLQPRWRGTSFSHPFVDADFGDFTGEGRGEIAALEVGQDGSVASLRLRPALRRAAYSKASSSALPLTVPATMRTLASPGTAASALTGSPQGT